MQANDTICEESAPCIKIVSYSTKCCTCLLLNLLLFSRWSRCPKVFDCRSTTTFYSSGSYLYSQENTPQNYHQQCTIISSALLSTVRYHQQCTIINSVLLTSSHLQASDIIHRWFGDLRLRSLLSLVHRHSSRLKIISDFSDLPCGITVSRLQLVNTTETSTTHLLTVHTSVRCDIF